MGITLEKPELKRGFVMTGGGAKGLYEAGVMHAFHLCGMEFDVITGSSIGAINAIIYAEYLYRRQQELDPELRDWDQLAQLEAEARLDKAVQAIDEMDPYFRRFFTAWLQLPSLNIIDDREDKIPKGTLARFKDDLLALGIGIPDLTRLVWWLTTPRQLERRRGLRLTLTFVKLFWELRERVGWSRAFQMVAGVVAETKSSDQLIDEFLDTYLRRFDLFEALVGPAKAEDLEAYFTQQFLPLSHEHLDRADQSETVGGEADVIFERARTLADYEEIGVDVRLTRANYRTGRLEISAHLNPVDFAVYLSNQIWRWEQAPKKGFPLGSHRLHLPGNPNAIAAAMASGRFPGVLAPYPVEKIYPGTDPENQLLHKILNNWLRDVEVGKELTEAYEQFIKGRPEEEEKLKGRWQRGFKRWVLAEKLREFFPQKGDTYVDGGAIDNTPTNTAIDAVREYAYYENRSKSDLALDLYTILLHPEPMLPEDESRQPALHRVVQRTLNIQGAAKLTSNASDVATINTFGERGSQLGEALQIFVEAAEALDPEPKAEYLEKVRQIASAYDEQKYPDKRRRPDHFEALMRGPAAECAAHVGTWGERLLRDRLPLQVNIIDVYPDEMPLSTLQFTGRLGYRGENAVKMIAMGCYNALWDLRQHLEQKLDADRDLKDQRALMLARRWMGVETWPQANDTAGLEDLRQSWSCKRTACVFHAQHCAHGANAPVRDPELVSATPAPD